MQWRTLCQSFDSSDVAPCDLPGSYQARANRIPIQQNRAGPAVARIASHLRPRQS